MGQLLVIRQKRKGVPNPVPKTLLIMNDTISLRSHPAPPPFWGVGGVVTGRDKLAQLGARNCLYIQTPDVRHLSSKKDLSNRHPELSLTDHILAESRPQD